MHTGAEIWEAVKNVFLQFHWTYVVEGIILFLLMYYVIKVLYENNAKRLIAVYASLVLLMGVVAVFSANFDVTFYCVFLMLLSFFFLMLFNIEIKRSVWRIAKPTAAQPDAAAKTRISVRADECIAGIVKAVQSLSKNNIGALIVLSNGNLPREIVESGVTLNSAISNQLIEGIFIPKAPLHDGAMIIFGDKIQAAGCFLPLTQREFPKDYGTRHRAGIGVTEVADVMTVIVSEETGIVSVVKRGVITRYVDSDGLKKFLREYYWKEFNAEGKK